MTHKFKLYPHQEVFMDKIRALLKKFKRIVMVAPTGYGKSTLITEMFKGIYERGHDAWFVIHRVELREQVEKILQKANIPYGLIIAGTKYDPTKKIQICMAMTLVNRIGMMKKPKLVFLDEAHISCSNTYKKILAQLPDSYIIGGTATPRRTDRRPMRELYQEMICSEDTHWLIENGYLSKYKLYRPSVIDISGVHMQGGDYNKKELATALDKSTITGDALEHYIKLAKGKKFIIFDYSVEASHDTAKLFTDAGFPCEHVDGETPKEQRKLALERFRNGDLAGLSNYGLFCEGVDIPDIECVIQKRPTKSIIIWRQSVGRGLRKTHDDKCLIILDHAGNSLEHGLPDASVEWSLDGRAKKSESVPPTRTCGNCFVVMSISVSLCPECGYQNPTNSRKMSVDYKEGELVEAEQVHAPLEPPTYPEIWFKGAFTLREHKAIAEKHGKKPGWGWYVWKDRKKRKAL